MTPRAVPAGNTATRRARSLVGAVAGEPATSPRMSGTTGQACQQPQLLSNVVLAGHPCDEEKLHRPSARTAPTVAGLSFSAIGMIKYGLGQTPVLSRWWGFEPVVDQDQAQWLSSGASAQPVAGLG